MQLFNYISDEELLIGLRMGETAINLTRGMELFEIEDGGILSFLSIEEMIFEDMLTVELINRIYSSLVENDQLEALNIIGEVDYGPPVYEPSKILALGRNYAAHAAEGGHKVAEEPIFFNKVITSIVPHEVPIVYPKHLTRVDHEIELALVISDIAKNISPDEAMDHVAGYTIANDITARDMQKQDQAKQHPWFRSKNFDTFCPIGPYFVPRDAIKDVHNLELELKVNGETRQKSNTSNMVFKIPEIISYLSKHMTLLPGDIILTGTPEGISPLKVGDVVEASIEGLGTLRNTVVE
jgi:5-oxopent-3-ene-1,2,5-tricarboxylate decarboxylase/2-hydroxyhepta-2,4-diene-1,7-dioate isomerase